MSSPEIISTVLAQWNLCLKTIHPELNLLGSPERTLFRTAFEDESGGIFVIEQIAPNRREKKLYISQILDYLHTDGLKQVVPCLKTPTGQSLTFSHGAWWQVFPFIDGTPLDRPSYIHDVGKGEALAFFLGELSRHATRLPRDRTTPSFSLKHYILKLEKEIKHYAPDVSKRFAPLFDFLRRSFMEFHDTLPVRFCHGDYHPLNIIWKGDVIEAVIDWEFCGFKSDIYDAANLVGCIGMEDPSGLTDNLTTSFIKAMRRAALISKQSWSLFAEFVLALRFAWLAEWLRENDREMIELEEVYMNLLVQNMSCLKEAWGLPTT